MTEHLTEEAVIIHVDFSENYTCKYSSEVQACHFGAGVDQETLHTGVLYAYDTFTSFAIIQNRRVMIHQPNGPVLDMIRETMPNVDTLHILSDGPTTQYRNKKNFFLFCTELYTMVLIEEHGICSKVDTGK